MNELNLHNLHSYFCYLPYDRTKDLCKLSCWGKAHVKVWQQKVPAKVKTLTGQKEKRRIGVQVWGHSNCGLISCTEHTLMPLCPMDGTKQRKCAVICPALHLYRLHRLPEIFHTLLLFCDSILQ